MLMREFIKTSCSQIPGVPEVQLLAYASLSLQPLALMSLPLILARVARMLELVVYWNYGTMEGLHGWLY